MFVFQWIGLVEMKYDYSLLVRGSYMFYLLIRSLGNYIEFEYESGGD